MSVEYAALAANPPVPWGTIALGIFVVGVCTGLLILLMLRFAKSAERMEKDAKYRCRWAFVGAVLYGLGLLHGVVNVITGDSPVWSLMFASPTGQPNRPVM